MDLKRRILVIDDDQSVCDMIARTLGKEGYEVFTETRSQEGVLKAGEILPDLVFISLLLGTTNGLKVSKELHSVETLRKVPVVMLISYTGELDPKYTVTIGVVDVLVKPLSERDILSETEAVLGPYTPQNRAAEEVIPEISAGKSIGETIEQEEGYVLERGEETETGIFARGDEHRDIRGAIDDEMQQRQEPVQEARMHRAVRRYQCRAAG
jgi:DNA-binding response OmpR family regulator